MNPKKTRIIVAENKELFRKGMVALLLTNPELDIVGEASNGRELIELLKVKDADIVLLDKDLTIMDTRAILEIMRRRFPETRTIILSEQSNAQLQSDFMSHGANSFLSRDCGVKLLFKAIYKVKTEGFFFDDSTSKALLEAVLKDKQRSSLVTESHLNDKETEILKRICDGNTNKEIAVNLHLSASTIDFHRTRIYSKTNCHNIASLLKYAIKNGLVALH